MGEGIKPAIVERKEAIGHSNYVHFLAENSYYWQLVMYDLNEGKFCTTTISRISLNPDCEATVLNNAVYCTGGRLKTAQPPVRADVKVIWFLKGKNAVTPFSPLLVARFRHATTTLKNSTLLVIGGLSVDNKPLAVCECSEVSRDRWNSLPSLNSPKAQLAACSFKDSVVYVFGGTDTFIECLDLSANGATWTVVSYSGPKPSGDQAKLWCAQASETEIIIFGDTKITLFDKEKAVLDPIADVTPQYVPERRNEVKVRGSEVCLMLNASGDLGLFSLSLRTWNIKPHIALVS